MATAQNLNGTGGDVPLPAIVRIPTGMPIGVRLDQALGADSVRPGDTFPAVLAGPLVIGRAVVAETGAAVTGQVIDVQPSLHGGVRLRAQLIEMTLADGQRTSLRTQVMSFSGPLSPDAPLTFLVQTPVTVDMTRTREAFSFAGEDEQLRGAGTGNTIVIAPPPVAYAQNDSYAYGGYPYAAYPYGAAGYPYLGAGFGFYSGLGFGGYPLRFGGYYPYPYGQRGYFPYGQRFYRPPVIHSYGIRPGTSYSNGRFSSGYRHR